MSPQPELRIGDADREAAASALGEHFASGRLTHEEYDERSARVWSAKTNSDLSPLFTDLPPLGRGRPQPGTPGRDTGRRPMPMGADRGGARTGHFRFPWLPVVLLVIGLSFLVPGPWWLILVGAFFFSRCFRHGRSGHAPRSWAG